MYRNKNILTAVVLSLGLLAGCDSTNSNDEESREVVQTSPVVTLSEQSQQVGTAELVRVDHGISFALSTELESGTAATLWLIIFNNPENCSGTPCAIPADVDNQATNADALFADGVVVGASGLASFVGRQNTGNNNGSMFEPIGAPAPGLTNARGAEIQLLVHSHGLMIPEYMPDMIQTFGGGCVHPGPPFPDPLPFERPAEWGAAGPNTCQTIQASVFETGRLGVGSESRLFIELPDGDSTQF